jgi:hypothetical protein
MDCRVVAARNARVEREWRMEIRGRGKGGRNNKEVEAMGGNGNKR